MVAEGPALEGTDLVIESLNETQRDLVLLIAVSLDAVPVSLDHLGKLLEGLQALQLEGIPPVVEEPASPAGSLVIPELPEGFLEEIGFVQPLVHLEQQLQGSPPLDGEVLPAGEEVIFLPFDESTILPGKACVLLLANLVHGYPKMLEDMELVVDDSSLRGVPFLEGGLAERLPHVHDRQADLAAFLGAEPGEELVQAR